jgi:hypothetical protein
LRASVITSVGFGALLALAACSSDDSSAATTIPAPFAPTSTLTAANTTSAETTSTLARVSIPSSSSPTTVKVDAGDWEGQRFDFGAITTLNASGALQTIEFDRYALYTDGGNTVDHWDAEPVLGWHSDVPWVNSNTRTRHLVLAADSKYLMATNKCSLASGDFNPDPPAWGVATMGALRDGVRSGYAVVSLTFDQQGQITQLRADPAC